MTDQTNHIEQIQKILDEVSQSNAFSAEAMKQFVALRDECEALERRNTYLREKVKETEEKAEKHLREVKAVEKNLDATSGRLQAYEEREAELVQREGKCLEMQLRCEYNETRVADHKEMVNQIFRNSEIRRSTFVALPGLRADDSYGNRTEPYAHPVQERETEE